MKHWKIARDAFYSLLYDKYGLDYIINAGFIFDASTENDDLEKSLNILCTPTAFLDSTKNKLNPCVLLSTGSFCPIHEGHIKMMEKAKEAVEKAGYFVAGGYLSPGHDEYINRKTGDQAIPIHNRIDLINKIIKDKPWLSVDPWEGLFNTVAINFTDVISRLKSYLDKHLNSNITVFYVFGGDNARFSNTFIESGHCVVVNRPGYDREYIKYITSNTDKKRILHIDSDDHNSSTKIRNNHPFISPNKKILKLRIRKNDAEEAVKNVLTNYFNKIEVSYVEDQKEIALSLFMNKKTISLDSMIESDHNLLLSRNYDIFGARFLNYSNRPGSEKLEDQIKNIPTGVYQLFDDDSYTGNTLKFVKNLLEKHDRLIKNSVTLNEASTKNTEILDARDFLFGFDKNSGLVVTLPDKSQVRLPYMYPYVCPFIRGSINSPLELSIKMWELNYLLHTKSNLKLKDVTYLARLANYLGFGPETFLAQICEWHINLLVSLMETSK